MKGYDHKEIEKKWQEKWKKENIYKTENSVSGKENFYSLVEFPYPSGNLHVGHWYAFSMPDITARFKRMNGYNVLFPIGFDAFGLPAENAAIKKGLNPREWTLGNIEYMKSQLSSMGGSFDWSREVVTCSPEYYKWTQWLFLKLYEKGLVYQKETPANWCPSCKTVLANEQVVDNKCERCGSEIEKKELMQWNLKITDYAERLLNDLDELDWPNEIKQSQKNWIGKKEGYTITFELVDILGQEDKKHKVDIFTTRPDTLFGVTFLAVSPNLAKKWIDVGWQVDENIKNYIEETIADKNIQTDRAEKEKTGIFSGIYAINPANNEKIPVWIVNYVLDDVGTGAIMAVPAHDERDFEFAKKFNLPIKQVITEGPSWKYQEESFLYTGSLGLLVNSNNFDGLSSGEAKDKIAESVGGKKEVYYKLRDWGVSRQRFWGTPIPMIYCKKCGVLPVPEKELPVVLPDINDYLPRDDGKSPLAKAGDWVNTKCPKCGEGAERETDTLDTFVDSSWYFLRYTDPKNEKEFANKESLGAWMPVDFYSGGAEHTTMHLLYSRFWHKALFDIGLVKDKEPYKKRMNRGLILGPDGNKMSKSKGNVIDPDEVVRNMGSDTVRAYLAFIGPFNEVGAYPWSPDSIVGIRRFIERVWQLQDRVDNSVTLGKEDEIILNQTIKKVTDDISSLKFNTAISQLMIFTNDLLKREKISPLDYETLLILLSPIAPHVTEELWEILGKIDSIHKENWPKYDDKKVESEEVTIAVQVNGKVKGLLSIKKGAGEKEVSKMAEAVSSVAKFLEGKEVKRVVYVENKIINIIITP